MSFDLILNSRQDLRFLNGAVSQFSAVSLSVNQGWPATFWERLAFWCE